MKNTLIGVLLAIAFLAALFAIQRFASHRPQAASAGATPAAAAAAVKDDFVGETKIGDWHLLCGAPKAFPRGPQDPGHPEGGNSAGTPPKDGPPPGFLFPRCHVGTAQRDPKNPKDEVLVLFRQVGFKRALTLFLRLPPDSVETNDRVAVRFDGTERAVSVRTCSARVCLAIDQFRKPEQPIVLGAKTMTLVYKPAAAKDPVAIAVPTRGLADAVVTMQRLNK